MSKARDIARAGTALSSVDATELGYLDGVTSNVQTQLDTKAASSTAVTLTGTQTLTNKTLTAPVISSITNTGTLTLPTSTGTVALTNGVINNTLTTTTGDTIYASSANTPTRLGIGSSGQVLTVSGGVPAWVTPAGGAYTQLSSAAYSGATSYTLSGISSSYKFLRLVIKNFTPSANAGQCLLRINSDLSNHASGSPAVALTANQAVWNLSTAGISNLSSENCFVIDFPNYADTSTAAKFGNAWSLYRRQAQTYHYGEIYVGYYNSSSAISSITILETGGAGTNISIGNVTLYGVN